MLLNGSSRNDIHELCFTDTDGTGIDDDLSEVELASVIRGGMEYANTDTADLSIPLFAMMDSDSIFTTCLTDSGSAVTDMPFNASEGLNKIGSARSITSVLPVAVQADGKDGSVHAESSGPAKQHQETLSSGTFVGAAEAQNDQQPQLSVDRDAVEDVNAADLIATSSGDFSRTTETMLDDGVAYKCTEGPVELSSSAIFSGSSQHSSEQHSQQDVADVADDDRSAPCSKSQDDETCNEQPGESSVVVSTINRAELVEDEHHFSSSVHRDSETANAGIQLSSIIDKDSLKPNNDGDAPAAGSMKETLSEENSNILPTGDDSGNVEVDNVYVELSPVTETAVDTALSDSPGHTCESAVPVECDVDKSAIESVKLLPGTKEVSNTAIMASCTTDSPESPTDSSEAVMLSGEIADAANGDVQMQVECDVDKSVVEAVKLLPGTNEVSNTASMVVMAPCTTDSPESPADSSEAVMLSCEGTDAANGDVQMQVECNIDKSVVEAVKLLPDTNEFSNTASMALCTTDSPESPTDSSEAVMLSGEVTDAANGDVQMQVECNVDESVVEAVKLLPGTNEVSNTPNMAPCTTDSPESPADSDEAVELNCRKTSAETSEQCTTETAEVNGKDMQEKVEDIDKSEFESVKLSPGTSELLNTASMVLDADNSQESVADSDQALLVSCEEKPPETSEGCTAETDSVNKDVNADLNVSVTCELEVTNTSSSVREQTVDEECKQQYSDVVDVASTKTGGSPVGEPVTDKEQKSTSVSAGSLNSTPDQNTDQSKAILGTESSVTSSDQVLSLPASNLADNSNKSNNSCKEDGVLLSDKESTSEPTNTVTVVSIASSTITESVEPESHTEADRPSSVIILKNSVTSTQPTSLSTPHSSSPALTEILQRTVSTAGSAHMTSSVTETPYSSTSTVNYRPAATLAMNVGKVLVTEFVFREIVTHEDKYKNASETEKVPVNN